MYSNIKVIFISMTYIPRKFG